VVELRVRSLYLFVAVVVFVVDGFVRVDDSSQYCQFVVFCTSSSEFLGKGKSYAVKRSHRLSRFDGYIRLQISFEADPRILKKGIR